MGIGGEVVWRVPSLSVPDPDQFQTAKALSQFEAVALYCDCAARATGAFELTDADGRAVAQICNRLDGIPLAIELAASRLNLLTVQELANGLQESFDVLGTGGRRAVARHQTLRTTIGWSYELLSSSEQSLFCRLSVFAGGFTVAAAQAVCMTDKPDASVIDLLGQLVAKSLVLPVTTVRGHGRFRVLEVLRQFGRERLLESVDADLIAGRHAEHCADMAEEWGSKLRGPEQALALDRLEEEHDNIRSALAWSRTSGRADLALRLINAVWIFWYLRGHVVEGLRNGLEVLSEFDGAQPARGSALYGVSMLAYHQRSFVTGERLAAEALDIFDREQNAGARGRELLVMAAMDHLRGRAADAERTYAGALDLLRGAGDDWGASFVLNNLGSMAIEVGRYEEAERLLSESLDCGRRIGDAWPMGLALANLGDLYVKRGMLQRAFEVMLESVNLQRDLRNLDYVEFHLDVCSRLTLACGQFETTLRLAGAAEAARRRFGIRSEPHEVIEINETLATAQRSLDSQIAMLAWQEGSEMATEQAIDFAARWLVGAVEDQPRSTPEGNRTDVSP